MLLSERDDFERRELGVSTAPMEMQPCRRWPVNLISLRFELRLRLSKRAVVEQDLERFCHMSGGQGAAVCRAKSPDVDVDGLVGRKGQHGAYGGSCLVEPHCRFSGDGDIGALLHHGECDGCERRRSLGEFGALGLFQRRDELTGEGERFGIVVVPVARRPEHEEDSQAEQPRVRR